MSAATQFLRFPGRIGLGTWKMGTARQNFGRARRAELFIVSKVLPGNASRRGTIRACEESIARMGCEYLDLYLLHWRGSHPFRETVQAFVDLHQRGLVRH